MKIGDFDLDKKVFVVAELSANHGGSFKRAIKSIKAAKRAGADGVKLQTYTPDTITLNSKRDDFMIKNGLWKGKNLYELYKEASTPWQWHKELFDVAREEGLVCFSSPFDESAVDFLEEFDPPAYKIASFEITDVNLIKYTALRKKPVILSTGIADLGDISLAIEMIKSTGNEDIALLKCTSSYPAPLEDANLFNIPSLKEIFGVTVGLSDHTLGSVSTIVGVALGARIIEKHFILDREIKTPDSSFSMDEMQFKEMVKNIREAEKVLGEKSYILTKKAKEGRFFARSLYASKDIKKGEIFTKENVKSVRPSLGLHPKNLYKILGKKAQKEIKFGEPIKYIE